MDPQFFISALVGGERLASRSRPLYPDEKAHVTHWMGSWVDLRTGLDDLKKVKLLPLTGMETNPSLMQSVSCRYSDCPFLAPVAVRLPRSILSSQVKSSQVILRPTVNRPVYLGVRHPSRTDNQFFIISLIIFTQLRI
jgi:hypothetical protein